MKSEAEIHVMPEAPVEEAAKTESVKEELSPERKEALVRASVLSDIILRARQDIPVLDGNLLQLSVHEKFWQRRAVQTKGKDQTDAKERLGKIQKDMESYRKDKENTLIFISFLDEQMRGEAETDGAQV